MQNWTFDAIGTVWIISTPTELTDDLKRKVTKRIDVFDENYSRFRSDSLVTKMSKKAGQYELPADAQPMMDLYKELYELTEGLVTPLIGRTIEQAGYDANYSFKPGKLITPPTWDEALVYDFPKLTIKKPVLLDFGALGKGYLVDIISEILNAADIKDFIINAGGDILVKGKEQTILLENPDNNSTAIGQINIKNSAFCGSGINRRNWGKYHHIIDPVKLISPSDIKAVWVQTDSTMLADGLSTALIFTSPQKLRQHFKFEYAMIVGEDIKLSKNFKAEFFRM